MKKDSFKQAIESEIGNKALRAIHDYMDTHAMNYWKFLCLYWQDKAGKCPKKSHQRDEYRSELECEAQLVSILELQVKFSSMSEVELKKFILELNGL